MVRNQTYRRPVIVVAWAFMFFSCLVALAGEPRQTDSNYLIVPGKSIGGYRLDWSMEQFIAEWGPPSSTVGTFLSLLDGQRREMPSFHHTWNSGPGAGFRVVTRPGREGVVVALSVRFVEGAHETVFYKTKNGIGILSTEDQVRETYGAPTHNWTARRVKILGYQEKGLKFSLLRGRNPEVFQVWIFREGSIP